MSSARLKGQSRRIVLELIVVVALVSFGTHFPSGESSAKAWSFVTHHPLVLLHVVLGTVVVGEAIVLLIRASLNRRRQWIVLSMLGLACVLIAWASGENYVATQHSSSLNNMSLAWLGAIVSYGVGWYWGHKKNKIRLATQNETADLTPLAAAVVTNDHHSD